MKRFPFFIKLIGILIYFLISLELSLNLLGFLYYHLHTKFYNPIKFSKNLRTILFIGESTTYGLGIPFEASFPFVVAKILNNNSKKYKITAINKGIPAIASSGIWRNLNSWVLQYRPEIVVIQVGVNDYSLNKNGLNTVRFGKLNLSIVNQLRTYRFFKVLFDRLNPKISKNSKFYDKGKSNLFDYENSEAITEQLRFNYAQMINFLKQNNIKVVIIGYLLDSYGYIEINSILESIAQENGVLYVGMNLEEFYYLDINDIVQADYFHPTVEGHRIIGASIAQSLLANDYLK